MSFRSGNPDPNPNSLNKTQTPKQFGFEFGFGACLGKKFPNENFKNKHCKDGILSMVNFAPDPNTSQFFITSIALPYFDDKYVQ